MILPLIPPPNCRLDSKSVREACDALRRLKTDRIDLMQTHWPDRCTPTFGLMTHKHAQKRDDEWRIEIIGFA